MANIIAAITRGLALPGAVIVGKRQLGARKARIPQFTAKQVSMPAQQIQCRRVFRVDGDGWPVPCRDDQSHGAKLFRRQGYFDLPRLLICEMGGNLSHDIMRRMWSALERGGKRRRNVAFRFNAGMYPDFNRYLRRLTHLIGIGSLNGSRGGDSFNAQPASSIKTNPGSRTCLAGLHARRAAIPRHALQTDPLRRLIPHSNLGGLTVRRGNHARHSHPIR